jgi:hypothetical protein
MLHNNMFNLPFNAIFFDTLYGSHNNNNYLFKTILLYLESLHFSGMWIYKFVELNFLDNIMDMIPGGL